VHLVLVFLVDFVGVKLELASFLVDGRGLEVVNLEFTQLLVLRQLASEVRLRFFDDGGDVHEVDRQLVAVSLFVDEAAQRKRREVRCPLL